MQAAPAIHCLLQALLGQPAANHTPGALSCTHQGRGGRSAPHRISNYRAFTSLFTQQLIPLLAIKLKIPSQLELCKSVSSAASWRGPHVDCEVRGTGTPRSWT
eukprot:1155625-Pelagomonas_calceolata.AAC.2